MLIQNNYDLILLGNIIIDDVYSIPSWGFEGTSNIFDKYSQNIGGIGNLIKEFNMINNNKLSLFVESIIGNDLNGNLIINFLKNIDNTLHLSDKQTSHALILSNLESNERTSFVNWGCGYDNIKPSNLQTRWKHISYIDILSMTDLDQCRKNSTIMSADVCLSNPNNINSTISKLHYFDYLFISESEFFPLIGDINNIKEIMSLVNMTKLKCIVLHTRLNTHLIYKDNYKIINNSNKIITNANVLGAGDVYCINFINYQLNNNINDECAAIHAHKYTTNYIALNKNEKI